ncbi:hypothetical protein ADICEAN_03355 [Cesiribacter andamanensis AMV16]|uniref:Secretion system C-terminal sorting domain-containing protein n=2 Tax=Cesiribacter TaxID=1133570 RepID=M7NSP4_9BACT|nr:hypothetical protein ADICEAN_03355 [Cesiribacter andamanensis AMV16]
MLLLLLVPLAFVKANFPHSRAGIAPLSGPRTEPAVTDQPAYWYEALPNGTVKLNVNNTTSYEVVGDLIRERLPDHAYGEILTEFAIPSGSTYSYIDDHVLPGETYFYVFEYRIEGVYGWVINFDTVTVQSVIPALGNFYLIAASSDDEYDILQDGKTIVIENTNIRAEANADLTGSVIFYLNGKRFKDNTAPFALFPETKGDFKKGRLTNGSYHLMAIAYPEKNGKGIPGDTLTVNFTVENMYEDAKVSLFPNPVEGRSVLDIAGSSNSPVTVHIIPHSGSAKKMIWQGVLNDAGTAQIPIETQGLRKGIYILSITVGDQVINKRFVVQ